MLRLFFAAGALFGLLAVVLGAFGAHALGNRLGPEQLHSYETATHYLFMHALALLLITGLGNLFPDTRLIAYSGGAMLAGTLLFSGSIYLLLLTGLRQLGPFNLGLVTPLGGTILIVGWLLLFIAALKH